MFQIDSLIGLQRFISAPKGLSVTRSHAREEGGNKNLHLVLIAPFLKRKGWGGFCLGRSPRLLAAGVYFKGRRCIAMES